MKRRMMDSNRTMSIFLCLKVNVDMAHTSKLCDTPGPSGLPKFLIVKAEPQLPKELLPAKTQNQVCLFYQ